MTFCLFLLLMLMLIMRSMTNNTKYIVQELRDLVFNGISFKVLL